MLQVACDDTLRILLKLQRWINGVWVFITILFPTVMPCWVIVCINIHVEVILKTRPGTRYSSCPWKHCKHCPFVQWSLVIAFLHCCIHTVTFCVLRCIRSKVSLFKVFKNVKNFSATPPAGICCYFERHVGTCWVMTVWVTPAKRMRKKKTF